jgi:pescadillo
MLTFLELYQTLLGFVFFKIYTDEGWQYPPPLDASKDERGAGIGALSVVEKGLTAQQTTISNPIPSNVSGKDVRAAIKEISSTNPTVSLFSAPVEIDTQMNDNEADEDFVAQPSKSDPTTSINSAPLPTYQSLTSANTTTSANQTSKGLFHGLTFWLSRETPRSLLEFVIRAFGGRVGWDERAGGVGSMFPLGKDETWEAVTHVIIDRPAVAGAIEQKEGSKNGEAQLDTKAEKRSTRKYVQPQWVIDCINAGTILSEDRYERGKVLPPHLSPFGEAKGAYQPAIDDGMDTGVTASTMADVVMGGVQTDEESSSEEEVIEGEELPDEEEEDEESANEDKEEEEKRKRKERKRQAKALKRIAEGDLALRAAELEAEAAGVEFGEFERAVKKAKKIKSRKAGITDEAMEEDSPAIAPDESAPAGTGEKEMNKMMMSNKQRKLYEKMKYSERKREGEVCAVSFHLGFLSSSPLTYILCADDDLTESNVGAEKGCDSEGPKKGGEAKGTRGQGIVLRLLRRVCRMAAYFLHSYVE